MVTQYKLTLVPDCPCRSRAEWGYCLYSGLLQLAPPDFGSKVHRDGITPVSQFVAENQGEIIWTVNLLGEENERELSPCLEQAEGFRLEKDHLQLQVVHQAHRHIADVGELLGQALNCSGIHRLNFQTPTAFKSRGRYLNMPSSRLILQNLIHKWNGCITECPIEDASGDGMESMAEGLVCREFRLHSCRYRMKGNAIPGFEGTLILENHLSGFHRQLADALLLFAEYAGIGIKTTLGMGGVTRA